MVNLCNQASFHTHRVESVCPSLVLTQVSEASCGVFTTHNELWWPPVWFQLWVQISRTGFSGYAVQVPVETKTPHWKFKKKKKKTDKEFETQTNFKDCVKFAETFICTLQRWGTFLQRANNKWKKNRIGALEDCCCSTDVTSNVYINLCGFKLLWMHQMETKM